MKKYLCLLLYVILSSNFLLAQENLKATSLKFDNTIHEKMYIVKIADYQAIKLIKFKDSSYAGNLTNLIWESNDNQARIKRISKNVEIAASEVKKMMEELQQNEFETLPNGETVKGCIIGSGGTTISLITKKGNTIHESSYWEPQSNLYYRNTQIPEIIKVRNILKAINTEINFEAIYNDFTRNLPDGQYAYGSMTFEKRRKR